MTGYLGNFPEDPLEDHQIEYNAPNRTSKSEEDDLGDAQPTTDLEDDDL